MPPEAACGGGTLGLSWPRRPKYDLDCWSAIRGQCKNSRSVGCGCASTQASRYSSLCWPLWAISFTRYTEVPRGGGTNWSITPSMVAFMAAKSAGLLRQKPGLRKEPCANGMNRWGFELQRRRRQSRPG